MATAEDLVGFKLVAARAKDLDDVAALLALHPEIDARRVRARVSEIAALADDPAILEVLDTALPRGPARRRPRKQRSSLHRERLLRRRRRDVIGAQSLPPLHTR